MANANGAIGWDDEVSDEGLETGEERDEFVVLPEGNYPFTVNKMERGSYNGSDKLPPCNMVKLGIIVDGGDKGRSYITTRFFMHTKMLWKIYRFLESVGLHKKGDGKTAIPWAKVVKGLAGRCKLVHREYKGETQCEVDKWLPLSEDAAQGVAPAAPANASEIDDSDV